ncbi:MAG: gamma carbonic anhydrase family protein [Pseudomonadales bacterium]|nr:gamma carbonic anhydrase family protein [Pseudomonadales bacterium]MCP5204485.1 gamma carbonic anhydrase family protein [Pseudomonadales bacterium]
MKRRRGALLPKAIPPLAIVRLASLTWGRYCNRLVPRRRNAVTDRNRGNIRRFGAKQPVIGRRVLIDPSAIVIGDVTLGDDVSIWPQAVVRGDMHSISVGDRSSVQDGCILHITHAGPYNPDGWPLAIGCDVTVGHSATLHGCTIGDRVLVGMGATIMDGAVVEDDVVVAACALVTPGKRLRSGFLYGGSPAREMRQLTEGEMAYFCYVAGNYVKLKDQHIAELEGEG